MIMHKDAISYIQDNPERFLRTGTPDPIELANFVSSDALIEGASRVEIIRHEEWWLIGSNIDWLESGARTTLNELFSQIIPFPKAGVNSIRSEVLVGAFAEMILTATSSEHLVIKGNIPDEASVWVVVTDNPHWKRVIAFHL